MELKVVRRLESDLWGSWCAGKDHRCCRCRPWFWVTGKGGPIPFCLSVEPPGVGPATRAGPGQVTGSQAAWARAGLTVGLDPVR
ncbi:hypothetical protein V6N11_007888 [Hibiscus sabdariffa]|uniref:Uncharacterized protein n=1 Tax=Hibiscus sabdariffa TaxID=183260 RepID=A0ABR2PZL8_9ROSI